jgi:hypothetical protein
VTETFTCGRHSEVTIEVGSTEGCEPCLAMLSIPVESLTGDQRADEVASWLNLKLSIPFHNVHQRLEALVGRPVWTHEMGSLGADRLIEEARGTRTLTSIDEVINDLRNTGKPVIEWPL